MMLTPMLSHGPEFTLRPRHAQMVKAELEEDNY